MNKKGFSLVELMIVVAIIGVLTAIAIPNFQAFQARSRQSEAKAALTSIYTAEQAFHSQWEVYAAPFEAIGYQPGGDYRYATGFDDALSAGDNLCADTNGGDLTGSVATIGCGPAPGRSYTGPDGTTTKEFNTDTYCEGTGSSLCDYIGPASLNAEINNVVTTSIGVNAFVAASIGDPEGEGTACKSGTVTDCDEWSINEDKKLTHVENQLN